MRYTTSSQQFSFYQKEGYVGFESLFNKEEASTLHTLLEKEHTLRLGPGEKTPEQKLLAGRDLEREDPALLKALLFRRLGQLAAGLFKETRIRLAFTQYFPCFPEAASIEEISSVTEILGCALINVNSANPPEDIFFPQDVGTVFFYAPHFYLPFPELESPLLLIAFAKDHARYKLQENDPLNHSLKDLGYAFGDLLTAETHPLILKH